MKPSGRVKHRASSYARVLRGRRVRFPAPRLLVSGDELHASLALVRALASAGYVPYLAIAPHGTYASRSRSVAGVVPVPHAEDTPAAFVEALARAAVAVKPHAILPGTEASLIALARRREILPCALGAPPAATVDLATDKGRVLGLAAKHGIDTPPSTVANTSALAARAEQIEYPAILKPLRTRIELSDARLAYYKAQRVRSAGELRALVPQLPHSDWVLQPYLPGCLSAVCGVAWQGQVISAVHQVSHRIWPPDVGYSTYAETVPADPELTARLARLLAEIGWSGLFQAQFLGHADGRRFMIDFNPRAYGSLALAVRAGANLPALWADLVLGGSPPTPVYRTGVRYRLEHNDVRALIAGLRGGDLSGTLAALVPRPRTVHAVFSLRDPGPLVTTAQKLLALRAHD